MDIEIVLPRVSDDEISTGLRWLTAQLEKRLPDADRGYGLGGEHGYGVDYENDTFMMHRYCWCESPECQWCSGCGCVPEVESYLDGVRVPSWYQATKELLPPMPHDVAEFGTPAYKTAEKLFDAAIVARNKRVDVIAPEVIHTCGHGWAVNTPRMSVWHVREDSMVPHTAPNFWHKPSGFQVWWYKYIGRGMQAHGEVGDFREMLRQCALSGDKQ